MRPATTLISIRLPTKTLSKIDQLARESDVLNTPAERYAPPPPWNRSEVIRMAIRTGLDTLTQAPPLTL